MPRTLGPASDARKGARTTGRTAKVERRPQGAAGDYEIKLCSDDDTDAVTQFILPIPADLNGTSLTLIRIWVTTVGSTDTEIAVNNLTTVTPMLTTNITIDAAEFDSDNATTPTVIADPPDSTVSNGDRVQVEMVDPGTGAQGHVIQLVFA